MPEEKKPIEYPKKKKRVSLFGLREEKKYFIENLGMLLGAGINPESAFRIIESGTKSKRMRRLLQSLLADIENGSPLWLTLQKSGILAERYITLVRIGEQTGRIVENLELLSSQEQKEAEFRSRIKSATLYPIFVLSLATVLGLGIAWFILPRLATVFSQLKVKLPIFTKILLNIGVFLGQQGRVVIPAFLTFLFFLIYILFICKKTKFIGQFLLFKLPGVHRLIKESELARFGYLMGTLLGAGIPLVQALESLTEATDFFTYKKMYAFLRRATEEGLPFSQSFVAYPGLEKLIPSPVQHIIMAAEQSGKLSEAFLSIGQKYDAQTEVTTKNLTTMLEPVLIIVIWLGVAFMALAIIMPIYSLISGLNK